MRKIFYLNTLLQNKMFSLNSCFKNFWHVLIAVSPLTHASVVNLASVVKLASVVNLQPTVSAVTELSLCCFLKHFMYLLSFWRVLSENCKINKNYFRYLVIASYSNKAFLNIESSSKEESKRVLSATEWWSRYNPFTFIRWCVNALFMSV